MFLIPYIIFIFIVLILINQKKISYIRNIDFYKSVNNIQDIYILSFLFVLTMITQFYTMDKEVLNWDINTYMIMGQDILRGNIPYENQFDNKGPLFYFIYSLPAITGKVTVVRIFNDIILSFLVCEMYLISRKIKTNISKIYVLLPSLYFSLYMSYPQGHPGLAEVYSVLPLAVAINLLLSSKTNKIKFFKVGFYLSISYLISPSVVLLVVSISIFVLRKCIKNKIYSDLVSLVIGASIPLLILLALYEYNGLLYELIFVLFVFPIIYTTEGVGVYPNNFIEYLTEYLSLENYFSLGLITQILFWIFLYTIGKNFVRFREFYKEDPALKIFIVLAMVSIVTFFNVPVPWWHYLVYYFFFSSFFILFIDSEWIKQIILLSILLCSLNVLPFMVRDNIKLLSKFNNIEADYPIYNEYKEIDEKYKIKSVVALSNHLMVYYFNIPGSNYIVHPSNYQKKSYVDGLTNANLMEENELINLIRNGEVDLLICNTTYLKECMSSNFYNLSKKYDENTYIFINKYALLK